MSWSPFTTGQKLIISCFRTPITDHWTGHGDSLTLESVTLADAGQYHCCATNTLGESISHGLVLEVRGVPVVEQTLTSVDAVEGEQMSVVLFPVPFQPMII